MSIGYAFDMGNLSVWYDEEGDTVGFAVLNVSSRKERELPFDVTFETQPGDV